MQRTLTSFEVVQELVRGRLELVRGYLETADVFRAADVVAFCRGAVFLAMKLTLVSEEQADSLMKEVICTVSSPSLAEATSAATPPSRQQRPTPKRRTRK
jgi:hypothetical protein